MARSRSRRLLNFGVVSQFAAAVRQRVLVRPD